MITLHATGKQVGQIIRASKTPRKDLFRFNALTSDVCLSLHLTDRSNPVENTSLPRVLNTSESPTFMIRTRRWRSHSKQGKSSPLVDLTFLSKLWTSCSFMSRSYPLSTKLKYIHVCRKRIRENTAKRRESWSSHIHHLVFHLVFHSVGFLLANVNNFKVVHQPSPSTKESRALLRNITSHLLRLGKMDVIPKSENR